MTEPHHLSRAAARRFLAVRHLLAPPRALPAEPDSVMAVVERLGSLQFDPLDVAGRNHDLVLLSRIRDYRREWTDALLYRDRRLYETYNKGLSLVPTAELPWFRVTWDARRREHDAAAFDVHSELVTELLDRIRSDGPLSSTDVAPRPAIEWYWRPTNQVRAILEALAEAGILGLSRREGNRRVYDLAERLFPAELLARREPERAQRRHKLLSRYRGHGLLGRSGSAELWLGTTPRNPRSGGTGDKPLRPQLLAELLEAGELSPVTVEGIRGERYVLTAELPMLTAAAREVAEQADDQPWTIGRPNGQEPQVAFLAPLDPYVWDREFLRTLHGFDYIWEVYVPEKKRRWGYYVLPILFGDRLVGRIEPRVERKSGTLRVLGLWWETGFDPLGAADFVAAFDEALEAHRRFGGMARIALPRSHTHRPLVAALRERGTQEDRP
ncbi:MAG: crosslink repair DNA glycosylase YcaQ family protein [Chloroflexota bacterium]